MDLEQKLKSIRLGRKGPTLYEHLLNIMGKMILDKVEDPLEKFEEYSEQLKNEECFAGFSDDPKTYQLIHSKLDFIFLLLKMKIKDLY